MFDRSTPIYATRYLVVKTPSAYDYFTGVFTYVTGIRTIDVTVCGGESIAATEPNKFTA